MSGSSPSMASSGITALDDILGGGFPLHRIHLVEGGPGAGKTTLGLQFLLDGIAKGDSCLCITLSETKQELHEIALSHGWSIEGIDFCELSSGQKLLHSDSYQTVFSPAQVELTETMINLMTEIERLRPKRLVIDSISELRLISGDVLNFRRQILALKAFFERIECTVLLLDDLVETAADRQLQALVHSITVLNQDLPEYGIQRRRLRVEKMRGVAYRGGYHDFNIVTGGLAVYPRLVAAEHRLPFDAGRISSGLQKLDQLLDGGLDRGTCCLLMGPAGVGKSTLALCTAIAAATRGEAAVLYTFDERVQTVHERMEALGIPLRPHLDRGALKLKQIDPAELTPGEFTHDVRKSVEAGATVVVIDSLTGYLSAMSEGRYLVLQMHELLAYLGQRGVMTALVLSERGMVAPRETSPTVDISYLADSVIQLGYFREAGVQRKWVSVFKRRSGRHDYGSYELVFSDSGLSIGSALTEHPGSRAGGPIGAPRV